MELQVVRNVPTIKSTIGRFSVNGSFFCFTLEDAVRPVKIPGQTAIPYGRYEVVITPSKRFGRDMPLLLDVPNFSGVRIHSGNTAEDTEGCILVGFVQGNNIVGQSHAAFDALFPKIQESIASGDRVWISVERGTLPEPSPKTEGFAA